MLGFKILGIGTLIWLLAGLLKLIFKMAEEKEWLFVFAGGGLVFWILFGIILVLKL